MSITKSYDRFTATEFDVARSFARRMMNDGTISGKLASNLIILNVLEELLTLFIDYLHNQIMVSIYNETSKKLTQISYIRKTEPSDSKYLKTIGDKIKFIDEYLLFENKEKLIFSLNKVNKARKNLIHNMLSSGYFRKSKTLIQNTKTIYSNSETAIEQILEFGNMTDIK